MNVDKENNNSVVLDESVDVKVERRLDNKLKVYRPESGLSDREVLRICN